MKPLVKNYRDFWAGVMFAAIGFGFAGVALTYKVGTAARMGPGYFPLVLGGMLAVLGLAIIFTSLQEKNAGPGVEKLHWWPNFWVLAPIVVFGILLKVLGMILMGLMVVIVSSIASEEFKLKPVIFLAIGLVAFCSLIFVGGLKLPIPLCPSFEVFEKLALCRV